MKVATLRNGKPDGELVVVSRDLARYARVPDIAPTLQAALDDWATAKPKLEAAYQAVNDTSARFDSHQAMAPLPRAYQFADGSFYLPHTELMSAWRRMDVPKVFFEEPMVYQGCSDGLLGARDPIPLGSPDWGLDFEAEVALILDHVPAGTTTAQAQGHVALVMLCNDISLRNLIPHELSKEFGFYQSKPASAFSPVAVTPDELGTAWDGNLVHRPLLTAWNGSFFGKPNAGVGAVFGFTDLIAHLAKTRDLGAGTIIGSGTVSNKGPDVGSSCIAEKRAQEILLHGAPVTRWMEVGDSVTIEMLDANGASIFGAIDQTVIARG